MGKETCGSHSESNETGNSKSLRNTVCLVLAGFAGGLGAGRCGCASQWQMEDGVSAVLETANPNSKLIHSSVDQKGFSQPDSSSGLVRESIFDQSPESYVDPSQCRVLSFVVQGKGMTIDQMRQRVAEADRETAERIKEENRSELASRLQNSYSNVDWARLSGDYRENPEFVANLKEVAERALQGRLNEDDHENFELSVRVLASGVSTDPEGKGGAWESVANLLRMRYLLTKAKIQG
jgi:hypothetical protein